MLDAAARSRSWGERYEWNIARCRFALSGVRRSVGANGAKRTTFAGGRPREPCCEWGTDAGRCSVAWSACVARGCERRSVERPCRFRAQAHSVRRRPVAEDALRVRAGYFGCDSSNRAVGAQVPAECRPLLPPHHVRGRTAVEAALDVRADHGGAAAVRAAGGEGQRNPGFRATRHSAAELPAAGRGNQAARAGG